MMAYTFISGATGGLGKAFAVECAKKGENLIITGRSEQKLIALKAYLSEINESVDIKFFACDLISETQRKALVDFIDGEGIKLSKILNVAGVDIQKAFDDYTIEKLTFQLRVNVEATVTLTHQLLKRRSEKCGVLTISSMSGATPMPYFAVYSASKAMLTNLFTSLHYEYKKKNVKITVVTPGGIPTREDIILDIKNQGLWGKLSKMSAEKVAKKSLKALDKNKIKYIPGFFNKLLNLIIKITPKRLVTRFIANRWKKQTKDAF